MLPVLAIDIGNTNIALGVFNGNRLLYRFAVPTYSKSHCPTIKKIVNKYKIQQGILCSVVPEATLDISKELTKLIGKKPLIIGKDIYVPIKNNYHNPKQVGQDRLVNAYAGVKLYGAPLIIVDFGTAITFDIVSKNKSYAGGLIIPGLGISLEALNCRTALLPKIKLAAPQGLIGKDTRNSMLSGVIYGFCAMMEGVSARLTKQLGPKTKIVVTGGDSLLIKKYCSNINHIDEMLTLKGINLIYKSFK